MVSVHDDTDSWEVGTRGDNICMGDPSARSHLNWLEYLFNVYDVRHIREYQKGPADPVRPGKDLWRDGSDHGRTHDR